MATKMNNRPIRPTPSRKSDFIQGVPVAIYSRSAADFRPPADYIGPRKSLMERPPDPSMNPKKLSLPVLSVSKLDVQVVVPPPSKSILPRIDNLVKNKTSKLYECDTKSILKNMPATFRKQFRTELRKKKPITGSVRRFVYRDFHDNTPSPEHVLHGILLLGGNHRDMVEELPQEPGTPPPRSGRIHCCVQTDTYLEDIADNETGFISTAIQCEPICDELLEEALINSKDKNVSTTGTQLDDWVFSDIAHAFDQLAENLTEAVIMESLKQLQEEFELEALRKQHEYHRCLRNGEMSILAKYKQAQDKYDEQKRYLQDRQPWDETLDQIIQLVGFDRIRDSAPQHYVGSQTTQAVYEHIQETMIPPINLETEKLVARRHMSRNILDDIIEESVLRREGEYAGRMYTHDPKKKGSLATNSPSRASLEYNEWMGELEEELDMIDVPVSHPSNEEYNQLPTDQVELKIDEIRGEGEAWDDIN